MLFYTVKWLDGKVSLLDQTALPDREEYLDCTTPEDVIAAIQRLSVRGAPAIGVSGAYAAVLAANRIQTEDPAAFREQLLPEMQKVRVARPTAVNLAWGIDRMRGVLDSVQGQPVADQKARLLQEAQIIDNEDQEFCRLLGAHGAELLPQKGKILTHCNAGALATAGRGTALSVIYAAKDAGKDVEVLSDETRPLLQGARLTAWECQKMGVPVTILCDNAAGWVLSQGEVSCVVVGSDRIAANGDVCNKIGTYPLAVMAHEHGVPFYVAAPTSTVDMNVASGAEIPIEQRAEDEVTEPRGMRIAPLGVKALNPAFDVTPNKFVTAIITEKGVARAPYTESLAAQMK
ncbi:MAG: S-methyl-5-thioribose-1-phosphate isomerase [Gemmatimonadetes bacterium]|nr:S-methyl-5-thioribose-1-phosphate isomerase [Gemmatimonadota bacterium]